IRAMKAGRAFFGDPFSYDPDGTMDLCTAEGFPMGRVVVTDRASHDVSVDLTGVPASATVRLLQGEIREGVTGYLDVNYLRDEFLTAPIVGGVFSDTVTIDTTLPCFVRVEVDDQGTASGFTNPLHFFTSVPSAGVPGPRVAAAVGDVTVTYADEFTLTGLDYTPGSPVTRLVVSGDEETPGLGELHINTGVLGAPDGVIGGGFTVNDYQNGVLTLVGMTGAGSSVEILWGATDVLPGAPRVEHLALSTGRPNPFGAGTVAELALPAPASVFLEVLDVAGRRIRLLADERLDAGVHRMAWDGRDSSGRAVANGVYFFRLRSGGEVLTSKAVRIR
ncbi:MAG: hypothetical protein HKN12_06845, partial [Gemmatimonadetes bacterium]|nr:hypothetical protein [Gemmatimonadota bacterium]